MTQKKSIKFVIIALTIILTSCGDNQNNFQKHEVVIEIYESTIPASGTVNQDILIELKAEATDGCYSDLKIRMIEIDSRHFLFKATAQFGSNGICPEIMVYKDTVIAFRPTSAGKYFFQLNEEPFEIRNDTLEINL